jgi:CrcB protein
VRGRILSAVALGGGIGACARYELALAFAAPVPPAFPTVTLTINLAGSLLLGALLTLILEVWPPTRYVRPFAAIGLLGGFTTFSTFVVETDRLTAAGDALPALAYVAVSLLGGIACCVLGAAAASAWGRRPARRGPST